MLHFPLKQKGLCYICIFIYNTYTAIQSMINSNIIAQCAYNILILPIIAYFGPISCITAHTANCPILSSDNSFKPKYRPHFFIFLLFLVILTHNCPSALIIANGAYFQIIFKEVNIYCPISWRFLMDQLSKSWTIISCYSRYPTLSQKAEHDIFHK